LPLPFQDRPGQRSKPGRPTDQVLDSHRRVHAALPWLGGNQTVDHRPRVPWHRQGVTTAFLDFGPHPFPEPALSHKTARSHVRRSPVQCGTLWRHWLQSLRAPHRTQQTGVAQEVRPARCGRQGAAGKACCRRPGNGVSRVLLGNPGTGNTSRKQAWLGGRSAEVERYCFSLEQNFQKRMARISMGLQSKE